MAEPPFPTDAVNATDACALSAVATTLVGAAANPYTTAFGVIVPAVVVIEPPVAMVILLDVLSIVPAVRIKSLTVSGNPRTNVLVVEFISKLLMVLASLKILFVPALRTPALVEFITNLDPAALAFTVPTFATLPNVLEPALDRVKVLPSPIINS
jgi:hypothetical protein